MHYSRIRRHGDPTIVISPKKTHGLSGTKTYMAWADMKQRCLNPNNNLFKWYGQRGITVCDKWLVFENFLSDMGKPPTHDHTLDRIDNDGDYSPNNCRWATWKEQGQNRRSNRFLTHKNKTLNVTQWSEIISVNKNTLTYRLKRGWTVERALTTPTIPKKLQQQYQAQ